MAVNQLVRQKVLAHAKREGRETVADERSEPPAFQRMERKLGIEKHRKPKPGEKKLRKK